jgi:hypothetical protein
MPVTGTVEILVNSGEVVTAAVEKIRVMQVLPGGTLTFRNPLAEELVSFLHIWLTMDPETNDELVTFDFQQFEL